MISSVLILGGVVAAAGVFTMWKHISAKIRRSLIRRRLATLVDLANVTLVSSWDDWDQVEQYYDLSHDVVGLDFEWVGPRPIALLQLASSDGRCLLVRLHRLGGVPERLVALLQDNSVVKLGVGLTDGDAKKLLTDFGIHMSGLFDLRHLLADLRPHGLKRTGLAGLAEEFLGVTLDKNWHVRAGNWEAKHLTNRQITYAANDALVAVNIGLAMVLEKNEELAAEGDVEEVLHNLSRKLKEIATNFKNIPPARYE